MKISGTERALPMEKIVLNISLLKTGISKLFFSLSPSLRLIKAYNYDLEKRYFFKKIITFEVSKFKFENNLALGFLFENEESKDINAYIEVKALDMEENIKEMSIFDIEILKPEIHINIASENEPEKLNIELEKRVTEITTYFKGLKISAIDQNTKNDVKVEIIRFSEEEYIENMDKIPIIFDIDSAIKEIIIYSNSTVKLNIQACYSDLLNNEYESNKSTIILQPNIEIQEEEFITTPIFNTIGFESPGIAIAST